MTDKEVIKGLECCTDIYYCTDCSCKEFCNDLGKLQKNALDLINRQQAEIEDLNHSIDTLGRVKEQLKETLTETEAKYQKEITRLDALLVCKNKVIRNLEKSFENAYDGAIKEFAERLKGYQDIEGYDAFLDKDIYSSHIKIEIDELYNLVKEMVGEDK